MAGNSTSLSEVFARLFRRVPKRASRREQLQELYAQRVEIHLSLRQLCRDRSETRGLEKRLRLVEADIENLGGTN